MSRHEPERPQLVMKALSRTVAGKVYEVTQLAGKLSCTCSGFKYRARCVHTAEAEEVLREARSR